MFRILRTAFLSIGLIGPAVGAQANIPQLRGDLGLSAGTQAPAGTFVGLLFNNYDAPHVVAKDGSAFGRSQSDINAGALTAKYSSKVRVLGGRWAAIAAVPWVNVALATPNLDVESGWGLSDIYLLPIQLGWSFPMVELLVGQGVYMPTGRFHDGARDNTGFGMWSYESTLGGTFYLGSSKQSNLSTVASYQIQSSVRGTDKRAGQVLTLEGGVGHNFMDGHGQFGVDYYARWKTTSDKNFPVPPMLAAKDRSFGVGPEVTMPVSSTPFVTMVTARYFLELGNRVATEGNSFYLVATAYLPARK